MPSSDSVPLPDPSTSANAADRLLLRPFTAADEPAARAAHQELAADDFMFLLDDDGAPWADYVDRLDQISRGVNLAPDRVAADLLAAEVDGELVGRVSIRHSIQTPFLAEFGGHIGYGTRPAYRRRGFARAMLLRALERTRALGVEQALVTCSDSNAGSAATIESCGGILESIVSLEGKPWRRYWVPTEPA
jgi:predicted acetyltransferase